MDFVCHGAIVLEVKARSTTGPADQAHVLNYLASSHHQIGLLLNFGTPRLEHKRYIWTASINHSCG
jgi:GxxExxY protein